MDAKFSREFCMGWRILCSVGDTKNTEGVPKSLGNLIGGAGSPMTPDQSNLLPTGLLYPIFDRPYTRLLS